MTDTPDTMLDMLRDQERVAEIEYHQAKAEADRLIAVADARLTMVRELIEKLTRKPRGRPRKDASFTTAAGIVETSNELTADSEVSA